ncbi:MAG: hypothetical protein FWF53_01145 [Candidatus Azobacteroides sp.]|nr:hypothetical protein [Candidatus Azobacteroides sp.]
MKTEHLWKNCFDGIKLTYTDVEEQIEAYELVFDQTRNEKVEWRLKLPMFVPPFYGYIKSRNSVPKQDDYWRFYVSENKDYLTSLNLSKEEKTGVRARVFRAYPSLVRDLHFGLYIKGNHFFRSVFYNEFLDIEYGIDLVVENINGVKIGLNLFAETKAAKEARTIKKRRPKKSVNFDCYDIPIDFTGSKRCGDFFLYSEREIKTIVEKIQKKVVLKVTRLYGHSIVKNCNSLIISLLIEYLIS